MVLRFIILSDLTKLHSHIFVRYRVKLYDQLKKPSSIIMTTQTIRDNFIILLAETSSPNIFMMTLKLITHTHLKISKGELARILPNISIMKSSMNIPNPTMYIILIVFSVNCLKNAVTKSNIIIGINKSSMALMTVFNEKVMINERYVTMTIRTIYDIRPIISQNI